jgi:hypothetical protein
MWKTRSEILAPFLELTTVEKPWKWSHKQQNEFDTMKKSWLRKPFWLTQSRKSLLKCILMQAPYQLGAYISQNGKPTAFYSRNLTPAQTWCTTTEQELLSIVKTLNEF